MLKLPALFRQILDLRVHGAGKVTLPLGNQKCLDIVTVEEQ